MKVSVNIGKETTSTEIDKDAALANPSIVVEIVTQLAKDAAVAFATSETNRTASEE